VEHKSRRWKKSGKVVDVLLLEKNKKISNGKTWLKAEDIRIQRKATHGKQSEVGGANIEKIQE